MSDHNDARLSLGMKNKLFFWDFKSVFKHCPIISAKGISVILVIQYPFLIVKGIICAAWTNSIFWENLVGIASDVFITCVILSKCGEGIHQIW